MSNFVEFSKFHEITQFPAVLIDIFAQKNKQVEFTLSTLIRFP